MVGLFQVGARSRGYGQTVGGVDLLLFVMYVAECFDETPCNARTVYLAYLDSVPYLSPRGFRRPVFQEFGLSYLEFARQTGFARAFLWACPPAEGDEYILSPRGNRLTRSLSHPPWQRMPRELPLLRWYREVAREGLSRGTVFELTNLVDECLMGRFRKSSRFLPSLSEDSATPKCSAPRGSAATTGPPPSRPSAATSASRGSRPCPAGATQTGKRPETGKSTSPTKRPLKRPFRVKRL